MPSPDPNKVEPRNKGQALRLAFLVASGNSLQAAADQVGIPYARAKVWHRTPKFKTQVDRLHAQWLAEASSVIVNASTEAAAEMVRLMRESKDDAIRLRAARTILEKLPSLLGPSIPKAIADMTDEELNRFIATGAL